MKEFGRILEDFGVLGGVLVCGGGLAFCIYQITSQISQAADQSGLLTLAQ